MTSQLATCVQSPDGKHQPADTRVVYGQPWAVCKYCGVELKTVTDGVWTPHVAPR